MDKKSILISSVVIALAATMLFATIATPTLAAKKTEMVFVIDMDEKDQPLLLLVCVGADRANVDGTLTIKAWDNGKVTSKLKAKATFYDGNEKIGTGHSGISTVTHSGDTIITVSKVTSTCVGKGQVTNSLLVTVKGVDKVEFGFE